MPSASEWQACRVALWLACPGSLAPLARREACAEAARSYFAVGEGCTLIYSAITWQQHGMAAFPRLQGLEQLISGADGSGIVCFIIFGMFE